MSPLFLSWFFLLCPYVWSVNFMYTLFARSFVNLFFSVFCGTLFLSSSPPYRLPASVAPWHASVSAPSPSHLIVASLSLLSFPLWERSSTLLFSSIWSPFHQHSTVCFFKVPSAALLKAHVSPIVYTMFASAPRPTLLFSHLVLFPPPPNPLSLYLALCEKVGTLPIGLRSSLLFSFAFGFFLVHLYGSALSKVLPFPFLRSF